MNVSRYSAIIFTVMVLLAMNSYGQGQKKILFFQTDWGRTATIDEFCEKAKAAGYDGIEVWLPSSEKEQQELLEALSKHGLKVGFLNGTNKSLPIGESLKAFGDHLKKLVALSPEYINCHTGSDFFTFEQNKTFIEVANAISKEYDIPVYHETHRGRFSFNLPDTKTYLSRIPKLKLNLDISHWMVVHESLLESNEEDLEAVIARTAHLHARVGHAEGPQVNDLRAPEWKSALDRHLDIWEEVIRNHWKTNDTFTLTTEFGPPNYMPTLPYTKVPVADQWQLNVYMMKMIKERLGLQ
ncbi:sugar phosphate isomerase/epimerase [Arenibacter sp. GZD96]|uniref:sugar phosphate isomerase/epimerase family protein n=1 Tax=Aurantibrevibacter litoralis TaxID=3106030 RepID=UPI002B002BCF|nr:sugar phosphate isomerase/epimerase [Arenibacter sp. GZD-96]MEA1784694.1 sugar phosphate isomerase/epimerase [Arenibacter sp. GZD-96]